MSRPAMIVVPSALRGGQGHGGVRRFHGIVRGYVYAVYKAGDSEAPDTSDPNTGVMCDVLLCEPGWAGLLRHVPVMVQSGGVYDHEHWTPRAITDSLGTKPLNLESGPGSTPLHETDGDCVIVAFFGGDIQRPVIVGQVSHPGTEATYTAYESYRYARVIAGGLFGVATDGDVKLDVSANESRIEVIHADDAHVDILNKKLNIRMGDAFIVVDGQTGDTTFTGTHTTILEAMLTSRSSTTATVQPVVLKQAQQDIIAVLEPLGAAMLLVDTALTTLTGSGVIADTAAYATALANLSAQVGHLATNTESD